MPIRRLRSNSFSSSDDESHASSSQQLKAPILVYHESARSIVFRDHLRRATASETNLTNNTIPPQQQLLTEDFVAPLPHKPLVVAQESDHKVDALETWNVIANEQMDVTHTVRPTEAGIPTQQIGGFQPRVVPLSPLTFGADDVFEKLLLQQDITQWSSSERAVVDLLETEQCVVKTIQNKEWGTFWQRFRQTQTTKIHRHADIPPDDTHPWNSFVTSTSLLPSGGRKMRCYGSTSQYTVGVIFELPKDPPTHQIWAWPAGYSAKTEFNIDSRGNLLNGRQEALVSLDQLRQYNDDYLHATSYRIGTRLLENANLKQIPYNEVYVRVGGSDDDRSWSRGVGLPVALFVRTATFGSLIAMLRTRARLRMDIPLLYVSPDDGVRVLTEALQKELWKIAADHLNPFQNPSIAHRTTIANTQEDSFQQKVDELIDLDESMEELLTPEELARIAGGYGATDESVSTILRHAMEYDQKVSQEGMESHKLQDVVNEGLAAALRAGDYHTSRQLLILYSLVTAGASSEDASGGESETEDDEDHDVKDSHHEESKSSSRKHHRRRSSLARDTALMKKDLDLVRKNAKKGSLTTGLPAPPPPPPLDTDRLRSATNSDGLLAVLGAAQVLRAMQDGSAKKRVQEVIDAVEEWVDYGQQSVAFRISSWYDQRAAQGDLQINTKANSNFLAFVSNKAVENRKNFAKQLRDAANATDFNDMRFLLALDAMLKKMHAPCLRLELLQYVLGLDNRYSVAHVARSVELAATCLEVSQASG